MRGGSEAVTVPTDPTARPSVAVIATAHTESILNTVWSKVVALVGAVAFGYCTFLEVKSAQPSNVRLALVAVPTLFCIAMLSTDTFFAVLDRAAPLLTQWRKDR